MSDRYGICIALLALLLGLTWAQQLAGTQKILRDPGLSPSCEEGLMTNVSCPWFLLTTAIDHNILDSNKVDMLCTDTCYESLKSARKIIKESCTDKDVVAYENVAYPATFYIDNYLFTYNLTCRRDRLETGQFCDPQILAWSKQGSLNTTQACSDCWLAGLAFQLNEPLGYDAGVAKGFASLTSSCNATRYNYVSPTPYALNATATRPPATTTATPPRHCELSHTIQAGDNCHSVAKAYNISTYNLLHENHLDLYCQGFESVVGKSLCIPAQCEIYTWKPLDSCDSVAEGHRITVPQFLAWNPQFNSLCQNSLNFIGYEVCVSPPGGYQNPDASTGGQQSIVTTSTETATKTTSPSQSTTHRPTATTTTSSIGPTQTGVVKGCHKFYTVQSGESCDNIESRFGISFGEFHKWNPTVGSKCGNLWLGYAYGVAGPSTSSTT